MEPEVKVWLEDMLTAIVEIEQFVGGERNFFKFHDDLKTRKAVERNIEIIGEAMKRVLTVDETIAIDHSRKIVDTRNRISHGYDSVSEDIIWGIVVRDLPPLKEQVKSLLGE